MTALAALVSLSLAGCAPTLTSSAGQWSAADSQEQSITTETVSIAALRCVVPVAWEDVSRSEATEVYPVAYSGHSNGGVVGTLRFSPDYHEASTVSEAVTQVSEPDATAHTEQSITGATVQPGDPYPGAVTARTAERFYTSDAGIEMVSHWWFLEDEKTGVIYAVEYRGEDTGESMALIEAIDASIRLGNA